MVRVLTLSAMAIALAACSGAPTQSENAQDASKRPLSSLTSDLSGILAGDRAKIAERRQFGRFDTEAFRADPRPEVLKAFLAAPEGKILRIDGKEGGSEFILTPSTLQQTRFGEIFPARGFEDDRSDLAEGASGRPFVFVAWISDLYEDLDDEYAIPDGLKQSAGVLEVSQYDDENAFCYRSTRESAAFSDAENLQNEEIGAFYASVAAETRAMIEENGAECRIYKVASGAEPGDLYGFHESYYTADKIRYPMGNAGYVNIRELTVEEFDRFLGAISD